MKQRSGIETLCDLNIVDPTNAFLLLNLSLCMKKIPIENRLNKGGLRSTIVRRLRDYSFAPPDLLWSRGWFHESDYCGDCSFLYPAYPTRYTVKSMRKLRGKKGLIWVRLGSYPMEPKWREGCIGDVATFARDVVGHLSGPTVLVTTDGDMSVPADLPVGVADTILADPNIVAWYTQHYDTTVSHPKLFPLPIGLGLHAAVMNRFTGVKGQAKCFTKAQNLTLSQETRIKRIWSDVHFRIHQHNGGARVPFADAIKSGHLKEIVDTPPRRLTQAEVWGKYGSYVFVMSLPGHGWESYRTWEALGLGAIVITIHSPIDTLIKNYRVVFLDSKQENWWLKLRDQKWLNRVWREASIKPIVDLSWKNWRKMVRSHLVENK